MTAFESRYGRDEAQMTAAFAERLYHSDFLVYLTEEAAISVGKQMFLIFEENDCRGNPHEFVIDFRVPIEEDDGSIVHDSILFDYHFHVLRDEEDDEDQGQLTYRCFGDHILRGDRDQVESLEVQRLQHMRELEKAGSLGGVPWIVIDSETDVNWNEVAKLPFPQAS